MTMLLEVTDLRKTFPARTGLLGNVIDRVHAVDGISFSIAEAAMGGGCVKTTYRNANQQSCCYTGPCSSSSILVCGLTTTG